MRKLIPAEISTRLAQNQAPTGNATVYYRIGTQPPVQRATPFFQISDKPNSLVLWCCDPSLDPVPFLLVVGISKIYIGSGEYKGNVNDIQVGAGIHDADGNALVWTAGASTMTDLTTYVAPQGALIGAFSSSGLVPGPVLGPPDNPPPPGQPSLDILFCFFSQNTQASVGQ